MKRVTNPTNGKIDVPYVLQALYPFLVGRELQAKAGLLFSSAVSITSSLRVRNAEERNKDSIEYAEATPITLFLPFPCPRHKHQTTRALFLNINSPLAMIELSVLLRTFPDCSAATDPIRYYLLFSSFLFGTRP